MNRVYKVKVRKKLIFIYDIRTPLRHKSQLIKPNSIFTCFYIQKNVNKCFVGAIMVPYCIVFGSLFLRICY
jgi:hypothetical protein